MRRKIEGTADARRDLEMAARMIRVYLVNMKYVGWTFVPAEARWPRPPIPVERIDPVAEIMAAQISTYELFRGRIVGAKTEVIT